MILDKNESSFRYLVQANKNSEWAWEIYIKFSAASLINTTTLCPVSALIYWLNNGDFDAKYVLHPDKLV